VLIQDPLFDLDQLARETGAPLAYTTDYWTPAELDAAYARYQAEYGQHGAIPRSHMWHTDATCPPLILDTHELHVYVAAAHCSIDEHDHSDAPLPGQHLYQANCPRCRWHQIDPSCSSVIAAWHDHAMPGWRALPTMPADLTKQGEAPRQASQRRLAWIQDTYPAEWQISGAPVLTARTGHATRPVAGRSPLGGYDLAAPK
jgi:uncharacterized protein DUF6349